MTTTLENTKTIGYYNPQSYPVQIYVSKLGRTFLLNKKGEYILNETGQKVNDPCLEAYVGSNLAKEISNTPIPIVTVIPRTITPEGGTPHSVNAATSMKRDNQGKLTEVVFPTPSEHKVPVSGMSIKGYTMKEAIKAGLAKPPPPLKEDEGPVERGTPYRADSLPEMTSYAPTVEEKNANYSTPEGKVVESFYKTLGAPVPSSMSLPQPNLPVVQVAPAPKAKRAKEVYTCPVCDKELKNRLGLVGHARFKHIEQYSEIMAAYPKGGD